MCLMLYAAYQILPVLMKNVDSKFTLLPPIRTCSVFLMTSTKQCLPMNNLFNLRDLVARHLDCRLMKPRYPQKTVMIGVAALAFYCLVLLRSCSTSKCLQCAYLPSQSVRVEIQCFAGVVVQVSREADEHFQSQVRHLQGY